MIKTVNIIHVYFTTIKNEPTSWSSYVEEVCLTANTVFWMANTIMYT